MRETPKHAEETLRRMEEYSRAHDNTYSVPREEGHFLHTLVELYQPKRILELGTSIGYSGTWMGLAAKEYGGKLITIEIDAAKIKMAQENFNAAGLSETAKIIRGDINRELKKLAGKFELVFMDSEKEEYLKHFRLFRPRLHKKAVIAADNAGTHPRQMRDYLDFIRTAKDFDSVFVPIGNGIELSMRK